MTLALLCQFTAQHVSDVNTSILRSLRLLVALLCRLTWGVLVLCSGIGCWWMQVEPLLIRIPHHQQPIPLHNTNTPQVSLHNNATSSSKLLRMDVFTSEKCWAVNWHNKISDIKLVYLYSIIQKFRIIGLLIVEYLNAKFIVPVFSEQSAVVINPPPPQTLLLLPEFPLNCFYGNDVCFV